MLIHLFDTEVLLGTEVIYTYVNAMLLFLPKEPRMRFGTEVAG